MKLLDDIEKVVDDFCLDKEEQAEDIIDWATTISNFSELGIEMGSLSFSCLKLHAYDFEIDAVKARLYIE